MEDLKALHAANVDQWVGKWFEQGYVTKLKYLTFMGGAGGDWTDHPKKGGKGILYAKIGNKQYPVGELIAIDPEMDKDELRFRQHVHSLKEGKITKYTIDKKTGEHNVEYTFKAEGIAKIKMSEEFNFNFNGE